MSPAEQGTRTRGKSWILDVRDSVALSKQILSGLEAELLDSWSTDPTFTVFSNDDQFHRVRNLDETISIANGRIISIIGHFPLKYRERSFGIDLWCSNHSEPKLKVELKLSGPNDSATDELFNHLTAKLGAVIQRHSLSGAELQNEQVGVGGRSATVAASPLKDDPLDELDTLLKLRGERRQRVFISYSHDDEAHKQWTFKLACDLQAVGVWVIFDQFLPLGSNLALFMSHNLVDSDRVIAVCTPGYVDKANAGVGGAGYETTVLTQSLMENQNADRVIPVIARQHPPYRVPTYLFSRKYIDFSNKDEYAERFEELARDILGAAKTSRPPLGQNPFQN